MRSPTVLIDADPQGSLTVSLGVKNPDELDVSLSTLMQSVIEDEQPPGNAIIAHNEGVDLLPSNIELSGMETGLFNVMSREYVLKSCIEGMRKIPLCRRLIMTVPENSYYVLGDNAEYSDDSRYWEDPFVSHEDVIAKLLLPESEERNSGILCASLVGDAHKERSSGLNCTGRPFFRLAVQSPMDECL